MMFQQSTFWPSSSVRYFGYIGYLVLIVFCHCDASSCLLPIQWQSRYNKHWLKCWCHLIVSSSIPGSGSETIYSNLEVTNKKQHLRDKNNTIFNTEDIQYNGHMKMTSGYFGSNARFIITSITIKDGNNSWYKAKYIGNSLSQKIIKQN